MIKNKMIPLMVAVAGKDAGCKRLPFSLERTVISKAITDVRRELK